MITSFSKELASHSLVRTSDTRRVILEEHSSAFKWLMASFLAINGGGLVALADMDTARIYKLAAGAAFWVGIVCALGIAWRGQVSARSAIAALGNIEAFWATAVVTEAIDQDELLRLESELDALKPGASRMFGWVSLLAFSIGMVAVGMGLK